MKIETTEHGTILLKEVFSGILFETDSKEKLGVCMRDGGYELIYGDKVWVAKKGKLDTYVSTEGINVMRVAEFLYYHTNPTTRMNVPNAAYEITNVWYEEWILTEPRVITEIEFFRWCLLTKQRKDDKSNHEGSDL